MDRTGSVKALIGLALGFQLDIQQALLISGKDIEKLTLGTIAWEGYSYGMSSIS